MPEYYAGYEGKHATRDKHVECCHGDMTVKYRNTEKPFCFCFAVNVDLAESELTVQNINKGNLYFPSDNMVSLRETRLSWYFDNEPTQFHGSSAS